MYYAAHPNEFFREDHTIFQFLAGDHSQVNSTLVYFVNVSSLTLHGDTTNATQIKKALKCKPSALIFGRAWTR